VWNYIMILGGDQPDPVGDFLNYVIKVARREFRSGESLTARGFKYVRRFRKDPEDPDRHTIDLTSVEGAADGSESSLHG
jgi:hypothetical protein